MAFPVPVPLVLCVGLPQFPDGASPQAALLKSPAGDALSGAHGMTGRPGVAVCAAAAFPGGSWQGACLVLHLPARAGRWSEGWAPGTHASQPGRVGTTTGSPLSVCALHRP